MTLTERHLRATLNAWVAALNACADQGVGDSCASDVVVQRYSWRPEQTAPVERMQGHEAVETWLRRSRVRDLFTLEQVRSTGPDTGQARYRVNWGDFVNHGQWTVQLNAQGLILRLEHRPMDIPEEWREGPPEGKTLPQG